MTMRYVLGNYINSGTLSSVSTEVTPAFGKEQMHNKSQSHPWRMSAKSGHAIFDFNSDRPTVLGILNHNLVGTGAFSLTLKTAISEVALGAAVPEAVAWHKLNIWHPIVMSPLEWWRIDISDPDNGSDLEFGEIVLFTYGEFTMNYWWPYKENMDYIVDEIVTHHGRRHRRKKAKRKSFSLDFEGVKDEDLVGASNEVEAFFDELDGDQPFIFIPDSAETDCWYVECLNSMQASRKFLDDNKFFLQLEEQARGLLML